MGSRRSLFLVLGLEGGRGCKSSAFVIINGINTFNYGHKATVQRHEMCAKWAGVVREAGQATQYANEIEKERVCVYVCMRSESECQNATQAKGY